jgi:hypothetical protein
MLLYRRRSAGSSPLLKLNRTHQTARPAIIVLRTNATTSCTSSHRINHATPMYIPAAVAIITANPAACGMNRSLGIDR